MDISTAPPGLTRDVRRRADIRIEAVMSEALAWATTARVTPLGRACRKTGRSWQCLR